MICTLQIISRLGNCRSKCELFLQLIDFESCPSSQCASESRARSTELGILDEVWRLWDCHPPV
eukprot:5792647-Amphidinium_carterae.1